MLYKRHFLLLIGFSVSLYAVAQLHLSSPIVVSFAAYAALHAAALIMSLPVRQSPWRVSLFIALAAGLGAVIVRIGLTGMQMSEPIPAYLAPYAVVGFSAMTGAAGYAILTRLFWIHGLSSRKIAVVSIVCMFATHLAIFTLKQTHFLGPWWLAVLWWYAFSGSLWYFDRVQETQGDRTCSGRTPRPRI